jgi:hypothetical protein
MEEYIPEYNTIAVFSTFNNSLGCFYIYIIWLICNKAELYTDICVIYYVFNICFVGL